MTEIGGLTVQQWLIAGLTTECVAAAVYLFYRSTLKKSNGYSAGSVLGASALAAVGGIVFIVVGVVAWLSS